MRTWAARTAAATLVVLLAPSADLLADQANSPSPTRAADEWVTTQIQARYFLEPAIKSLTIHVSSLNGIVTLDGQVNTPDERARAVEIAQRTSGVQSVVNNLTLADPQATASSGAVAAVPPPADEAGSTGQAPEAPPSEGAIVALIRSSFAADPGLSILDIDVQVEQGIVRLSGDVPDLATRVRAERLARAVRGVSEVRNDLVIKR